jgi:hypothetical protein
MRLLRHRYAISLPFLLLMAATVIGGRINSVDAHGRVVDDTTDLPVSGIAVTYGSRSVVTGDDGSYVLTNLPRGARLQAQKAGYSRSFASAEATELRLTPLTITFEVKDETTSKGIDTPEARQPATVRIGTGTASGEMAVGPYPVRDKPVIICAKGYESKEVFARGVLMDVSLKPGGTGCPPLPTSPPPAQVPSPSPSATGGPPSASPSP